MTFIIWISIHVSRGEVSLRLLSATRTKSLTDWSLPDQLLFSIVGALLKIASAQSAYRNKIVQAILAFVRRVVQDLNTGEGEYAMTRVSSWK